MAHRQAGAQPRRAGLQRHDGLAERQAFQRGALEGLNILQPLDVQPDGAHLRPVRQSIDEILEPEQRLVSSRNHEGEGSTTLAHGEVGGQHAALGDDRRAISRTRAAMGEGPQRDLVHIVDDAVAIGPDECEITGGSTGVQATNDDAQASKL